MSSVAGLKDCEFSLPQEYGKALLNCIEALLKGNVESFAISVLNVPQDMCGPYIFLDTALKANLQIRTKSKFVFIFGKT